MLIVDFIQNGVYANLSFVRNPRWASPTSTFIFVRKLT